MDKEAVVYTHTHTHTHIHTGIFSHKKEGNSAISKTWMELEGIVLREMSHTQRDKYCMTSLTRGTLKRKPALKKRSDVWLPKARGEEKTRDPELLRRDKTMADIQPLCTGMVFLQVNTQNYGPEG